MECWIPLFEILLNSPCPETDASKWLQQSFNSCSTNASPISTASFLSLLTTAQSPSPHHKRIIWIQTLPDLVQARILSFLAYDHRRFCKKELCKLARIMLSEGKCIDFWVNKAAQHLFDLVSTSNYQWSEEENMEEEFYSMPDWLRDAAIDSESMFHWLPISVNELRDKMPFNGSEGSEDDLPITVEEDKQIQFDKVMSKFDEPIDAEVEKAANCLKSRVLNIDSTSKALELAEEIRGLCFESKANSLGILNLIEPWGVDDETAAVLVSHMSDVKEVVKDDWPSHILCSIVFPKFLVLNEPASRVLMNATIEYCKAHQRAAEYALLLPLVLRSNGVNIPVCEVITRIVKECLHSAHVSAFCQKVLSEDKDARRFVCLPCHRDLVGDKLVWTEELFSLWQNILNHNVHLMQDSVDHLVNRVCQYSERYSKSLKFGNFVLCLVKKCSPFLKPHKGLLTVAVEKTDTLVTKSIMSKLSGL